MDEKQDSFDNSIEKLTNWLKKKNFDLYFGAYEDIADHYDKTITIDSRKKKENQLYILLHECGHIIVNNNKNFSNCFPYMIRTLEKKFKNKKMENCYKYRMEQIIEETDAWKAGKLLAKKLSIPISNENFHNIMIKKLWTYVIN